MGIIAQIKAALAAKRVVKTMGQAQRGYKTVAFWLTLVGNLVTLAAALKGVIPATTALVAMTALAALYNVLRGAQKSEQTGVRTWWKTTEFWLGVGAEASKALLVVQDGGVNPAWLAGTSTVLAGVMAVARDLSHQQPAEASPPK